jgi:ABC-type proline/glycine betaine transport system permease subunit
MIIYKNINNHINKHINKHINNHINNHKKLLKTLLALILILYSYYDFPFIKRILSISCMIFLVASFICIFWILLWKLVLKKIPIVKEFIG